MRSAILSMVSLRRLLVLDAVAVRIGAAVVMILSSVYYRAKAEDGEIEGISFLFSF